MLLSRPIQINFSASLGNSFIVFNCAHVFNQMNSFFHSLLWIACVQA